eukprot:574377-Amphidinium_carterae.1
MLAQYRPHNPQDARPPNATSTQTGEIKRGDTSMSVPLLALTFYPHWLDMLLSATGNFAIHDCKLRDLIWIQPSGSKELQTALIPSTIKWLARRLAAVSSMQHFNAMSGLACVQTCSRIFHAL